MNTRAFLILGAVVFRVTSALAAPCCGGSAALPAMITGDDRAQLQSTYSQGIVVGDAPSVGIPVFRAAGDDERSNTFRLEGAYRVFDRVQFGGGIPLVRRARSVNGTGSEAFGFGDVTVNAAYEVLPEWDYSSWRPKGFLFLQTTLPTGSSTYDSRSPLQLDARGRGFFSLGLGSAFLKTLGNWDFLLTVELHRSLGRTATDLDDTEMYLRPGFGGSIGLGAGYSPWGESLRLGVALAPQWEQGIRVEGAIRSQGSDQLVWNLSFQTSYLISDEWSVAGVYSDQTLLGPVQNVSLNRALALSVMKRWNL